jgi:hypothetical protein
MKVYVDDVDQHFARTKAQGATIVSDPRDGRDARRRQLPRPM